MDMTFIYCTQDKFHSYLQFYNDIIQQNYRTDDNCHTHLKKKEEEEEDKIRAIHYEITFRSTLCTIANIPPRLMPHAERSGQNYIIEPVAGTVLVNTVPQDGQKATSRIQKAMFLNLDTQQESALN